MKKLITTASLAALGACSLQAANTTGLTAAQTSKPWSVSAALRGFYDDNYTTLPSDPVNPNVPDKQNSFGISVSPSVSYNALLGDQTLVGLSYTYDMRWYEDREENSADHSHQFDARLNHRISERYSVEVKDSFVIAQEPEVIDTDGTRTTFFRTEGDNIRNLASAELEAKVTELLGVNVGYSNGYYNYDDEGPNSRSALLDRMEHRVILDSLWQVFPQTQAILGYQFGYVDHPDDNILDLDNNIFTTADQFNSEIRNSRNHYAYIGGRHNFTAKFTGEAKVGVQYREYPDAPAIFDDSSVDPYVSVATSYRYNPGSYVQIGLRHEKNSTDVVSTLDQQATTIFGLLNHRITPKLNANVIGQYQNSDFDFVNASGAEDNYFLAGLNLSYQINQFLAAETGYNFDRLDSDLPDRSFTRNRVYVGIRATY